MKYTHVQFSEDSIKKLFYSLFVECKFGLNKADQENPTCLDIYFSYTAKSWISAAKRHENAVLIWTY